MAKGSRHGVYMVLFDKNEFRSALSEFATGVTVITTLDDEGNPHTMTANSFTSVCLEPPIVLICVAHGTHTYGFLEQRKRFGVNFLTESRKMLARISPEASGSHRWSGLQLFRV